MKCAKNYKKEFTDLFKAYFPLNRCAVLRQENGTACLTFLDKVIVMGVDEIENASAGMYNNRAILPDIENILYKKGIRILEIMYRKAVQNRHDDIRRITIEFEEARGNKMRKCNVNTTAKSRIKKQVGQMHLTKNKVNNPDNTSHKSKTQNFLGSKPPEEKHHKFKAVKIIIKRGVNKKLKDNPLANFTRKTGESELEDSGDTQVNKSIIEALKEDEVEVLDTDAVSINAYLNKLEKPNKPTKIPPSCMAASQKPPISKMKNKENCDEKKPEMFAGFVGNGNHTPTYVDISDASIHEFMKYEEADMKYGEKYFYGKTDAGKCAIKTYVELSTEVEEPVVQSKPKKRRYRKSKQQESDFQVPDSLRFRSMTCTVNIPKSKHIKLNNIADSDSLKNNHFTGTSSSCENTAQRNFAKNSPMKCDRFDEDVAEYKAECTELKQEDSDESFDISEIEEVGTSKILASKTSTEKKEGTSFVHKETGQDAKRPVEEQTAQEPVNYSRFEKKDEKKAKEFAEELSMHKQPQQPCNLDTSDSDAAVIIKGIGFSKSNKSKKGIELSSSENNSHETIGYCSVDFEAEKNPVEETFFNPQTTKSKPAEISVTKIASSSPVKRIKPEPSSNGEIQIDKLYLLARRKEVRWPVLIRKVCLCYTLVSPEYEVIKTNDVFKCEATFYDAKFSSNYEYTKKEAKDGVAKLVAEYLEKNISSIVEKNTQMKNEAIQSLSNDL